MQMQPRHEPLRYADTGRPTILMLSKGPAAAAKLVETGDVVEVAMDEGRMVVDADEVDAVEEDEASMEDEEVEVVEAVGALGKALCVCSWMVNGIE